MNLYVPVALPPRMLKLQCFCVSSCKGTWLYAYFRSLFEKYSVPVFCFNSLILHAIVSIRWSMLWIWYLFLSIASFNFFESNAIFMDLSCFTVITTGLIKYSSEHLSNLFICLSSISLFNSFSILSIKCSGTLFPLCCVGWNVLWNVDFAMWFFDFPILAHRWGYFWSIHFAMLFCGEFMLCIFSPDVLKVNSIPSFWRMSLPCRFTVFCGTTRIWQLRTVVLPDVRSSWIC